MINVLLLQEGKYKEFKLYDYATKQPDRKGKMNEEFEIL